MKNRQILIAAAFIAVGSQASAVTFVPPVTEANWQETSSVTYSTLYDAAVLYNSGDTISYTVNTLTAGTSYTFNYTALFEGSGQLATWSLTGGATLSGSVNSNVTFAGSTFTASAAPVVISFSGVGNGNKNRWVEISDVTLVAAPVPEPETYAMMAAGLGIVGFVARRRRTR